MKVDCHGTKKDRLPLHVWCPALVLILAAGALIGIGSHHVAARPAQNASASSPASILAARSTQPLSGPQVLARLSRLPIRFEPNVGQADRSVKFMARGSGYGLFLRSNEAVIALHGKTGKGGKNASDLLSMKLVGADPGAAISGTAPLPGKTNYFFGNNPAKWHHDVPQFARVKYESVYPGIDVVFYGNQGQLEYDFRVAAGANPSQAELEFTGATQIELQQGNLLIKARTGEVRFQAPNIYQEIAGRKQVVDGRFVMRAANRVGFEVGAYDRGRELVIDPNLTYATYFGGNRSDTAPSVAVDNAGNIYLAGTTDSDPSSFPPFATQTLIPTTLTMNPPNTHVFVAKINPSSTASAIYETFIGGTGSETNVGIGVDGAGNAYIAGTTTSHDFPTTPTNAYQATTKAGSTGTSHVYVTQLDPSGCLLSCASSLPTYSSYLSGTGTDVASGMTIDSKGNIYVTGTTTSSDTGGNGDEFPATAPPQAPPYQPTSRNPGGLQFFVTKVDTAAPGIGSIIYSTYFGGAVPSSPIAIGGGIAVDGPGNIYFSGTTNYVYTGTSSTTDFPILNAYQPCLDTAPPATPTTTPTCSNTSSTTNPDAFLAKLNPNTQSLQLVWSTYFGGSGSDSGTAVAVDSGAANVYLTGVTNSSNFTLPTTSGIFQACLNNDFTTSVTTCATQSSPANDAYVARFPNLTTSTTSTLTLAYFSYIGGAGNEAALALTVDTTNDALVTGWTQSGNTSYPGAASPGSFPVTAGAIQSSLNGSEDAFFARINTGVATGNNNVGSFLTYYGGTAGSSSGITRGTGVAIDSNLNSYFAGDTNTSIETAGALQGSLGAGASSNAFAVKLTTSAAVSIAGQLSLGAGQQYISAGNQATFTYTITNTGPDVAQGLTVTDNLSGSGIPVTFNTATATPGSCSQSSTTNSTVACTIGTLQSGSTAKVTIAVTPTTGGNFNGGVVQVLGPNNVLLTQTSVSARASDFQLSISPSGASVSAGSSTQYTVVLNPLPVYGSSISLTVAGLPTGATQQFSPSSLTLNGPESSTLTISTTARPVTTARSRMRGVIYALWVGVPGIALFGVGAKQRRRKLLAVLFACGAFTLLALQPACSSSKSVTPASGTPAGTYTLTVTATSGTLTHSQTFTLTVL